NAMLEAGASAYCVKGAPIWELERAIAGAGEPLVRLAQALSRGLPGGVGQVVARELAELSAGLCAATYLSSGDVGLSLAGIAGAPARAHLCRGAARRADRLAQPARLRRARAGVVRSRRAARPRAIRRRRIQARERRAGPCHRRRGAARREPRLPPGPPRRRAG